MTFWVLILGCATSFSEEFRAVLTPGGLKRRFQKTRTRIRNEKIMNRRIREFQRPVEVVTTQEEKWDGVTWRPSGKDLEKGRYNLPKMTTA